MKWASRCGDGYLWVVISLVVLVFAEAGGHIFLQLAVGYALELGAYKILKRSFNRPRPFVHIPEVTMLILPPDEFSFPSGHTAAAFVMATIMGVAFPPTLVLLVPLAMTIGISRVYLGVHYPTDVIAGTCLGIAAGVAGSIFV